MSTVTVLVLLFGYHTSTEGTATTSTAAVSPAVAGTTSSGSTGSSGTATSGGTSTTASATFTGSAADTRWGPVQVEITVANGEITAVDVVEYPSENGRDQEINARALPTLVQETLSAQNAAIDMVSGATVTSTGYLTSLQSALDQAGL
ncbi:FMN-binding protein [Kineococcus sp. GCM10028916]|uniref:FMN-binding protein n=1 Tax=Kineococcus sp. GCM10028916 TaxID=3273394 RepID=UPI003644B7B3